MATTTKPEVIYPIVHLNGTGKDQLIENLCKVRDMLEEAKRDLKQAAPNGRDYYTVPGRMDLAVEQHMRRMKAIDNLVDNIDSEIIAIDEQGAKS